MLARFAASGRAVPTPGGPPPPGPFAFANAAYVRGVLERAGFSAITNEEMQHESVVPEDSVYYPLVVSFGIRSYFRHERDTITVCHHLYHGRKRGGPEPGRGRIPTSAGTKREGLVAQAVSFLQQDQPMLIDIRKANAAAKRASIIGGSQRFFCRD